MKYLIEYKLFLENSKPNVFYHGSSIQNLHTLSSRKDRSGDRKERGNLVYATNDKGFAAGMSFIWSTSEGVEFDFNDDLNKWILKLPKELEHRLTVPVSLYIVDPTGFQKISSPYPEYGKVGNARILKEFKYSNVHSILKDCNVKLYLK